jgi:signal transduction histidine kinase
VPGLLGDQQHAHAAAERNYATRNELLGIVSHDLRGPLTTISRLASLIEQHVTGNDTEALRAWTVTIKQAAGVMERLIGELLDFGSLEDGRLRVAAETKDIRALLRDAVDAFQPVAAAKRITIEIELPAEPMIASYDRGRILRVLSNLLDNAITFTRDGGSIAIGVERSGAECVVAVSDTGIGIPQRELTTIFQRFRQPNGIDRTGPGLGLYVSMWIVEAHGGRMWADSRVRVGTTFYFTLPSEGTAD